MSQRSRQQKIQIARRQLAMNDDDYRALLRRVTGQDTSKGLTAGQADAVLAEFQRLGWKPAPRKGGKGWREPEPREDLRFILVLWRLLSERGVVDRGRHALNGFVGGRQFHAKYSDRPTDLRFLTVERARDVIEALKAMCARNGIRLDR